MKKIKTHTVVIGGGSAGLKAYRTIKENEKSAIIIEKNDFITTCASVGCMPSKLLISASNAVVDRRKSKIFGIKNKSSKIKDKLVMERVLKERDRFVGFVKEGANNIPREDKIIGSAYVKDKNTVIVNDIEIKCENIIIATGSKSYIPNEFAHLGEKIITNNDLFYMNNIPDSIAIIGTGVIALEIGQALNKLGKKVKIFGRGGKIGFINDEEINKYAIELFNKDFYVDPNSNILKTELIDNKVKITYKIKNKKETDFFDNILIAAGRIPVLDFINEKIKIKKVVNKETMKSEVDNIFLVGDVNSEHPVLHEAVHDGYIAGINASFYPNEKLIKRKTKLSIMFTNPDIMSVGENIKEIQNKYNDDYIEGVVSFENQGRSRVMLKNKGILKIYAKRSNGIILGAEMIGPSAEHIAHLLAWSIQSGITVDDALEMPYYHPVIEEGVRTCFQDLKNKMNTNI